LHTVDGERQRRAPQSAEAVRFEREREREHYEREIFFVPFLFFLFAEERALFYLYKEYIHISQK